MLGIHAKNGESVKLTATKGKSIEIYLKRRIWIPLRLSFIAQYDLTFSPTTFCSICGENLLVHLIAQFCPVEEDPVSIIPSVSWDIMTLQQKY